MVFLTATLLSICLLSVMALTVYRLPAIIWVFFFLGTTVLWIGIADQVLYYSIAGLSFGGLLISCLVAIRHTRQCLFIQPFHTRMRERNVHISQLEKQALAAGSAGFETGFFTGRPNWAHLQGISTTALTEEERAYLSGPVEEFCSIVDDWQIRQKREIPTSVWEAAARLGLFSLRVPKRWGGLGFSTQAQSLVLSKVASRSVDASILVELSTSLYPDELIAQYGTTAQQHFYLPRLAAGREISAFAVTGVHGSDVGGMHDRGVVTYGEYAGARVLGIRVSCRKRYITFAPNATLIVLSFVLTDPDNLLQNGVAPGITLALVPADHPGIDISERHYPAGLGFPHGPVSADDVFIPLEWVIGGARGVGLGWQMIMQCLFYGRAMALPAMSDGFAKTALLSTTAYAEVRRQFGLSLRTFGAVQDELTDLAEISYTIESARALSCALIDEGSRPLALSSLMKYRATSFARDAINHAMDVHAGRAVCDGPSNYLLFAYQAIPIGITVEGANIISRSVITYAQGVMQSHPHFHTFVESVECKDSAASLRLADRALCAHVYGMFSNAVRTFLHGLTFGYFGTAPHAVPKKVQRWYRLLWWQSSAFAFISDVTILLFGPELKKQQRLCGRLSDILSELFLLTSVLKRYEDEGFPGEDLPLVTLTFENGLARLQEAMDAATRNVPNRFISFLLRRTVFPFGVRYQPSHDRLRASVAACVQEDEGVRARLTKYTYVSHDPDDAIRQLEVARQAARAAAPVYKKLRAATRAGLLAKNQEQQLHSAVRLKIITAKEAAAVQEAERTAAAAIAVDSFPKQSG